MSSQQHWNRVTAWFDLNGQPAGQADRNWPSIIIKGKKFYLFDRFIYSDSGYSVIYGYCVKNNQLHCRMFYYSASEASWRAFTGFRRNGAWIKSAEQHGTHEPGGYIFEGMVCEELEDFLGMRLAPPVHQASPQGKL